MELILTLKPQVKTGAATPRLERYCLSLQPVSGGSGFSVFEKRTAVRICVFAFFVSAAAPVFAAVEGAARVPSVTFDDAITTALVATLTALGTWLGVKGHAERRATEKVRVEMDRMPPLGEDTAKTYATKKELCGLENRLSHDVGTIRTQIDQNDKALRTLVETANKEAERRVVGTHSRIDSLYKSQNKTNRSLGVLIGQLSVIAKCPVSIDADETED